MVSYIIGINKTFFFQIGDVRKINIIEDDDLVEFIGKKNELIFAANKMDMDFVAKWEGGEIPSKLAEIYGISSNENLSNDGDGSDTEPTTEQTTEPPADPPSEPETN